MKKYSYIFIKYIKKYRESYVSLGCSIKKTLNKYYKVKNYIINLFDNNNYFLKNNNVHDDDSISRKLVCVMEKATLLGSSYGLQSLSLGAKK